MQTPRKNSIQETYQLKNLTWLNNGEEIITKESQATVQALSQA